MERTSLAETSPFDRITVEVGKMNGQPCIRGLRLTVRRVLEASSTYDSREELRADYPELEERHRAPRTRASKT